MTTVRVDLYMSEHSAITPNDLANHPAKVAEKAIIFASDKFIPDTWTKIGTGVMEFSLNGRDEVQRQMIVSLENQLREHRAKSQQVENQILGRIRDLKSLPAEIQS